MKYNPAEIEGVMQLLREQQQQFLWALEIARQQNDKLGYERAMRMAVAGLSRESLNQLLERMQSEAEELSRAVKETRDFLAEHE
jgi:hypothetical protein